jgi:hypothetical protein
MGKALFKKRANARVELGNRIYFSCIQCLCTLADLINSLMIFFIAGGIITGLRLDTQGAFPIETLFIQSFSCYMAFNFIARISAHE